MADGEDGLGLDEVLGALRRDLLAAQRASGPQSVGLAVREVQIELAVEVTRHTSGSGEVGAKWFVLSGSASGEASRDRTSTNRITLTLGPVSDDGATTMSAVAGSDVSSGVIPSAVADADS